MKLEQFRSALQGTLRGNSDLFYPLTLEFSLGIYPPWSVRLRVVQPTKPQHKSLLEQMVQDFNPNHRLLYLHPDDTPPALGARAEYQGGRLEIVGVGQESAYLEKRTLAAVFSI